MFKSDGLTGVLLLVALAIAIIWANWFHQVDYERFWHSPIVDRNLVGVNVTLQFLVNDILMTLFFYVVGIEIRKETDSGALNTLKIALLPIIAAFGGVVMPALIYTVFNRDSANINGWAVPTATDIAFAIGLLTLFGKAVSNNFRAILLSLAIVDDIIAVIIIALFYSHGGNYCGLVVVAVAIIALLYCQGKAFFRGYFYIIALAVVWIGLALANIHPSLAGVIVGIIMPVNQYPPFSGVVALYWRLKKSLSQGRNNTIVHQKTTAKIQNQLPTPFSSVRAVNVLRTTAIFKSLGPWVSFVVIPLFILANAGLDFDSITFNDRENLLLSLGIMCGLAMGKPIGIVLVSYVAVKLKLCQLPDTISWYSMVWIGLLAGIGFTMSLFIAMLAFENVELLKTAKLAVQLGSALSAILAVFYGLFYLRKIKQASNLPKSNQI